jgi:glycosyltransferase involved in cell wall biosynthesis
MSLSPLVSIGIPVYNGAKTIDSCIKSVLNQTYGNIEIIISDNYSSDSTAAICRDFANLDSRITLVVQDENIGPVANFDFVLSQSTGTYFMWLAADDFKSQDFIEVNLEFLQKNLEYVASTCPNRFEAPAIENHDWEMLSLEDDQKFRIINFLRNANRSHGLFYSLFRADILKQYPWFGVNFLAWDWLLLFYFSLDWKFHRSSNGSLVLGANGQSTRANALEMSGVKGVKKLWPLSKFTILALITVLRICPKYFFVPLPHIWRLNSLMFKHQFFLMKHKLKKRILRIS